MVPDKVLLCPPADCVLVARTTGRRAPEFNIVLDRRAGAAQQSLTFATVLCLAGPVGRDGSLVSG